MPPTHDNLKQAEQAQATSSVQGPVAHTMSNTHSCGLWAGRDALLQDAVLQEK